MSAAAADTAMSGTSTWRRASSRSRRPRRLLCRRLEAGTLEASAFALELPVRRLLVVRPREADRAVAIEEDVAHDRAAAVADRLGGEDRPEVAGDLRVTARLLYLREEYIGGVLPARVR